ncbi:MAG: aminotransferase class III-fold pyridoxal phosphate-dependent enzyme, partial [Candidatus Dadabacteria bacterium]|nr:aminotransferase class III-fold pyridoxal phosphate-dependent enzyme [Candidatus Dadabacteria bacterium]
GATDSGQYFLDSLKILENKYSKMIKEVRGKGLILGIQFKNKEIAIKIINNCIENGLLTILTIQKVMRILPPLNVKKKEIDIAVKTIEKALKEVSDA